jgi:hypothetical protein
VRADAHGWVLRTFESCAGSDAMADYAGISTGHSTLNAVSRPRHCASDGTLSALLRLLKSPPVGNKAPFQTELLCQCFLKLFDLIDVGYWLVY